MVDAKTTLMTFENVLHLFLETEPFWSIASLNKKYLIICSMCVSFYTPNVLDLLTKVIIIYGYTHWIFA